MFIHCGVCVGLYGDVDQTFTQMVEDAANKLLCDNCNNPAHTAYQPLNRQHISILLGRLKLCKTNFTYTHTHIHKLMAIFQLDGCPNEMYILH